MTIAPISRSIHVAVPLDRAFRIFTSRMGDWWAATHHIAIEPFTAIVVEPQAGGRWFERDAAGNECPWGQVLEWEPPHRVVLGWQLTAEFKYDPDFLTEVEVTFVEDGSGTLVTLTHKQLERFGDMAKTMAEGVTEGWGLLLGLFRDFADKENGE